MGDGTQERWRILIRLGQILVGIGTGRPRNEHNTDAEQLIGTRAVEQHAPIALVLQVIIGQQDFDILRRGKAQRGRHEPQIGKAPPLAIELVNELAVVAYPVDRDAGIDLARHDWPGNGTAHVKLAIIAHGDQEVAAQFILGFGPSDVDHAADGIRPEQLALRTAQHFQTFDIDHVQQLPSH